MRKSQFDLHTKVKLSSNIYASEIAGEAIILERSSGMYYGLNATGAAIYKYLKEPIDLSKVCQLLLEKYEADPQELKIILQEFIQEMLTAKIVVIVD